MGLPARVTTTLVLVAAAAGCSFDSSGLDAKRACHADRDCRPGSRCGPEGRCIQDRDGGLHHGDDSSVPDPGGAADATVAGDSGGTSDAGVVTQDGGQPRDAAVIVPDSGSGGRDLGAGCGCADGLICGPDGQCLVPCSMSSSCAAGYHCSRELGACVQGPCTSDEDCAGEAETCLTAEGRCACATDDACQWNHTCNPRGWCVPRDTECARDEHCPGGTRCSPGGRCVPQGVECETNQDCLPEQHCNDRGWCLPLGWDCQDDAQCGEGNHCNRWHRCVPGADRGVDCVDDAQCPPERSCRRDGRCLPDGWDCGDDGDCDPGRTCDPAIHECVDPAWDCHVRGCPMGYACNDMGQCQRMDYTCGPERPCQGGMTCEDGTCRSPDVQCFGNRDCGEGMVCNPLGHCVPAAGDVAFCGSCDSDAQCGSPRGLCLDWTYSAQDWGMEIMDPPQCTMRCDPDHQCPRGLTCIGVSRSEMHLGVCVPRTAPTCAAWAAYGNGCGLWDPCPEGSDCVFLDGIDLGCTYGCSNDQDCPDGAHCGWLSGLCKPD